MTKRLGRGLADLIDTGTQESSTFVMLKTDQIRAGRFQPRSAIRPEGLEELKASIKKSGVIEPVVVRPVAHGTYELVAGERRLRAAQAIGLQRVPAIVKTLSDKEALELSLIENIQRENLNPMDEAKGYKRLIDEFSYTQEETATAVGKDRATVANMLRLLTLPEEIRRALEDGRVSVGHAKALLGIEDRAKQLEVFRQGLSSGFTVRQTEAVAGTVAPSKRRARKIDPQLKAIEDDLCRALGTKVRLQARKKGGRLVIDYFSNEDFTRILQVLGISG